MISKIGRLIGWLISMNLLGVFFSPAGIAEKHFHWYRSLNISSATPPDCFFGMLWPFIYVFASILGWMIWEIEELRVQKALKFIFILELIFGVFWGKLFFELHKTHLVFILRLLMVILALLMMHKASKVKIFLWLVFPCFLWLLFSAYLSLFIVLNN